MRTCRRGGPRVYSVSLMARRILPRSLIFLLLSTCRDSVAPSSKPEPNPQAVSVLTQHNDNSRTGWNDNEAALTAANVNVQHFGEVFMVVVDDQVYAQPLVVGHVFVGGGYHM